MSFGIGTFLIALIGGVAGNFGSEIVKSIVRGNQRVAMERDADLEQILQTLNRLTDLGERFWGKACEELGNEAYILRAKIRADQQYLAESISKLFDDELKRNCDVSLVKLFGALSGDDFDDPNRDVSPKNLTEIFLFAKSLKAQCRKYRAEIKGSFLS